MPSPNQQRTNRSYSHTPKSRRRFSAWTLLAPAAVAILWITFFSAINQSCLRKNCKNDSGKQTKSQSENTPANNVAPGKRAKVKPGDTLGSIAQRFGLTTEEIQACNPNIDPQALNVGVFLKVSAADCENADKAPVGADPDLFADKSTNKAQDAVAKNGTAKADPSASSIN